MTKRITKGPLKPCPGCGFLYYSAGSYMNHTRSKTTSCTPEARFWGKVNKTATCWIWTGALNKDGYGNMQMPRPARRSVYAHRRSWEVAHGPIPEGMQVLHHCDTPACVNPEHLFLGTHTDNMRDKRQKGREPRNKKNGRWIRRRTVSARPFTEEPK